MCWKRILRLQLLVGAENLEDKTSRYVSISFCILKVKCCKACTWSDYHVFFLMPYLCICFLLVHSAPMLADHIIVLQPRQYLRSRWKETVNQLGSSTVRSPQQQSMPHWYSASCCLLCGFILPRSADANFFISGYTLSVNRWKGWKCIMKHWFFRKKDLYDTWVLLEEWAETSICLMCFGPIDL